MGVMFGEISDIYPSNKCRKEHRFEHRLMYEQIYIWFMKSSYNIKIGSDLNDELIIFSCMDARSHELI